MPIDVTWHGEREDRPQVNIIVWANNAKKLESFVYKAFMNNAMFGSPDLNMITIPPELGFKNMGQAYEYGRQRANELDAQQGRKSVKVYMHQDLHILDRTFCNKVWELLRPNTGIGGLGIFGSTIDTGGAYFMCHPRYQRGIAYDLNGRGLHTCECSPVKVLDGVLIATNQDIPWPDCYEKTHMFIEHMCMEIRKRGLSIWTLDSANLHESGGSVDDTFWRSLQTFRRIWKRALPEDVPPVSMFKEFYEVNERNGGWNRELLKKGAWDVVWKDWAAEREEAA